MGTARVGVKSPWKIKILKILEKRKMHAIRILSKLS